MNLEVTWPTQQTPTPPSSPTNINTPKKTPLRRVNKIVTNSTNHIDPTSQIMDSKLESRNALVNNKPIPMVIDTHTTVTQIDLFAPPESLSNPWMDID